MLEYIDRKGFMGADVASRAVQMHNIQTRKRIEFPHPHECSKTSVEDHGPLRLNNFLVTYRAKQMKQRNSKTGKKMKIMTWQELMVISKFMSSMRLRITPRAQRPSKTRGAAP